MSSGNISAFIQPALSTKQDKLTSPSENDYDGWRFVPYGNIVRRLIGDDKILVAGGLDLATGSNSITDIKISLNTNLTGLTNYYNKTEVDNGLALKAPINNLTFTGNVTVNGNLNTESSFWVLGHVDGTSTPPIFADLGGHVKSVTVTRDSGNAYLISWTPSHPKSTSYAFYPSTIGSATVAKVRLSPGTATSCQVVVTSTGGGSFITGNFMITVFK